MISIKFSVDVIEWPRYQTAKKNCGKFQPAEYGAATLQTDRQQSDGTAISYSEREREFAKTISTCDLYHFYHAMAR